MSTPVNPDAGKVKFLHILRHALCCFYIDMFVCLL